MTPAQLESVAGGQLERIVAREETLDLGPAVGAGRIRRDPLLARVEYFAEAAFGIALDGSVNAEMIDLARLATLVGDDAPQAALCASIRELLALALTVPLGEHVDGPLRAHPPARQRGRDRRHAGRSARDEPRALTRFRRVCDSLRMRRDFAMTMQQCSKPR